MKPPIARILDLLCADMEAEDRAKARLVAQHYIITSNDAHYKEGQYECPPATALYFAPSDFFSIFDASLEKNGEVARDEIKRVAAGSELYQLYLVAELYSKLRDFQDLSKMYPINTECLLLPGAQIFFPRCDYFALYCTRYQLRRQNNYRGPYRRRG